MTSCTGSAYKPLAHLGVGMLDVGRLASEQQPPTGTQLRTTMHTIPGDVLKLRSAQSTLSVASAKLCFRKQASGLSSVLSRSSKPVHSWRPIQSALLSSRQAGRTWPQVLPQRNQRTSSSAPPRDLNKVLIATSQIHGC